MNHPDTPILTDKEEYHQLIQAQDELIRDLQEIISDLLQIQTCNDLLEGLREIPTFKDQLEAKKEIPLSGDPLETLMFSGLLEARKAMLISGDQLEALTLSNRQGALMHDVRLEVPVLIVHLVALKSSDLAEVQVFSVHLENHLETPVLRDRAVQVRIAEEDNDLPLFLFMKENTFLINHGF